MKSAAQRLENKEITIYDYAYKWEKLCELLSGTLSDLTALNKIVPYDDEPKFSEANTRRKVDKLQKIYMKLKGQV